MTWSPVAVDERERIIALAKDGFSSPEIADKIGRSATVVRTVRRAAGLSVRNGLRSKEPDDAERERVIALRRQGLTLKQIAKAVRRDNSGFVKKVLVEAGEYVPQHAGPRDGRVTSAEDAEIARRYRAGESMTRIGAAIGRSQSAVSGSLVRSGLREPQPYRAVEKAERLATRETTDEPAIAKSRPLPVIESDWIRPPTKAQLMAGR